MSSNWEKMTAADKLRKAHIAFMRHREFALLSGVAMVGQTIVSDKVPTAKTNGRDVWYGEKWVNAQDEKQLRYIVAHENFHKALRHCTEYTDLWKQYPKHCAVASDLVTNGLIEEMDPKFEFVARPTDIPPLVDPKFKGWSFIRILRHLLTKFPPPPPQGGGNGQGQPGQGQGQQQAKGKGEKGDKPQPGKGGDVDPNQMGNGDFDDHEQQEGDGDGEGQMSREEMKEAMRQVDDAVRQGKMVQEKLAGNEKGGADLNCLVKERDTNWKQHLRDFVTQIVKGDDNSRFCPPNKRLLASGFIMPSHFSESTGELHIYCDTSGSMGWLYPIVFGEVAQIVKDVLPEKVRVIWWDTEVAGEQVFEPKDYDNITTLVHPCGGGGTTPDVVRKYVDKHQLKAKCGIWLTDGDFYTSAVEMPWPVIWGVYGNDQFVPVQGKVVHLDIPNRGY